MSKTVRIALFGDSGSGKTTLLSSFYGNLKRPSFLEDHGYQFEALDLGQSQRLVENFHSIETGNFPRGTDDFEEFEFELMLKGARKPSLQVVWYDYQGGWWDWRGRISKDEEAARVEGLRKLARSDVGMILIDGNQFRDQGVGYAKVVIEKLAGTLTKVEKMARTLGVAESQGRASASPGEWIIAISKADVLEGEETARSIGESIEREARDPLSSMAGAVGEAFASSRRYLLLSSVLGRGSHVYDPHAHLGLTLIVPTALCAKLESQLTRKERWRLMQQGCGYSLTALSGLVIGAGTLFGRRDDIESGIFQLVTNAVGKGLQGGAGYFKRRIESTKNERKALRMLEVELNGARAERCLFQPVTAGD